VTHVPQWLIVSVLTRFVSFLPLFPPPHPLLRPSPRRCPPRELEIRWARTASAPPTASPPNGESTTPRIVSYELWTRGKSASAAPTPIVHPHAFVPRYQTSQTTFSNTNAGFPRPAARQPATRRVHHHPEACTPNAKYASLDRHVAHTPRTPISSTNASYAVPVSR
jgi:hypothetical protein